MSIIEQYVKAPWDTAIGCDSITEGIMLASRKDNIMALRETITKTVLTGVLATSVMLVGCGGAGGDTTAGDTGDTDTTTAVTTDVEKDVTEDADEDVVEDADAEDDTEVAETKWLDATDASDAATKANLTGGFVVPDKLTAHGMEFSNPTFSYVDGIAQATYEQPAAMIQIRKGHGPGGTVVADDGTGYSGEMFSKSWEITDGGLPVTCYGENEGEILFAQWYNNVDPNADGEDDAYSVRAIGLGGEDIPMTEEELSMLTTTEVK